MERRQAPSDGVGRMLGVLGILVASGGSAYLYKENQDLKQQVAAVEGTVDETKQQIAAREDPTGSSAAEFNQKWNDQLVAALEDFKTRGNTAIERLDREQVQRSRLFEEELAKLPAATDIVQTADVEAIVERKLETLRKVAIAEASPQLRVATNVLKPSDGSDANVSVIVNEGDAAADIELVSFRPKKNGQFELDESLKMGSGGEDNWVIRFLPEENTATTAGRHHHYERRLLFGDRTIPARRSVRVAVEIENSKHVGWGLAGDLVIEYGDGRTLTSPARAVFVAGDSDSA